jgi:hypothetical protein
MNRVVFLHYIFSQLAVVAAEIAKYLPEGTGSQRINKDVAELEKPYFLASSSWPGRISSNSTRRFSFLSASVFSSTMGLVLP